MRKIVKLPGPHDQAGRAITHVGFFPPVIYDIELLQKHEPVTVEFGLYAQIPETGILYHSDSGVGYFSDPDLESNAVTDKMGHDLFSDTLFRGPEIIKIRSRKGIYGFYALGHEIIDRIGINHALS